MIYFKLINIFLLYITLSYCYNQNNNNNNIQNNNNNCLEVTIQDSFGDGWEDGTYLYYTYDDNNNLNMTNSLTLSNCSYSTFTTCLKPQDTSHYIHLTLKSILDGIEFTPAFYWEMQYTVKLYDDNGDLTHQYYGGFNTSMVFKYDEINNYQLEWWENLWTDPEEANICGADEFSFSDTCSQFTVTTNLFNSTNSGNYENAGWFISPDDNADDLVDYGIPWSGAVYSNSSSSDCSICLESGSYLFRVTGALYALEEEISWSFCGVEGKGQIEMSFTVTNSICEPISIRTLSMICESEVIDTSEPTFYPTSAPSSSPTLSPTPLPSTNPTFVPSSLPSLQPTPLPSTNPTLSPTFTPTVVPSYRPSFNPTSIYDTLKVTERTSACYSDCSYPGMTIPPAEWSEEEYCAFYSTTTCSVSGISGYSCVPSCLKDCSDVFCDSMSTLVYSCDPNVRATYRNKTVVESACLESFSSNAQTKTLMSFTTDSTFDGVSPTEMQNDPVAQQAAIVAMSLSVSGVPADQITIESISGSDNRRLDFSLSLSKSNLKGSYSNNNKNNINHNNNNINLEAAQAILTYKITATLESLGFTADSYELAYSQLTNQISTSVASGQFQQNLKAAGQTAGVSTFTNAEVTKIPTYSSPEVVLLITAPPTGQPTSQPTRHKSKSSEDDDNVGAIAGGVVGGFFGLLLIIGIIYCVYKDRQRRELESKFLEHNSNTQKKSEPSVPTTTDPYANNNPLQNDDVQVSFAYDNNNETDLSGGGRSSTGYQRPSQIVTQGAAKKDARDADVFL